MACHVMMSKIQNEKEGQASLYR